MDFKDYMNKNEGAKYYGTGGAFGKSYSPTTRDLNRYQDFNDRVAFGKSIEDKIFKALVEEHNWKLTKPSGYSDKYEKIDGYWNKDGTILPIQIKYRDADSKDDILVEVIKPWNKSMFENDQIQYTGRDMIGKAQIYVVLNKSGNKLMVRDVSEIKEAAEDMTYDLMHHYNQTKQNVFTYADGSQIRITQDRSNGTNKVIAYINPQSFHWKMDLPLKKNLWS